MRPRHVAAKRFFGDTVIVDEVLHRVPPRWRRMRSAGGKIVKELVPETTKKVPILGTVFVDTNRRYPAHGKREAQRAKRRLNPPPSRAARQHDAWRKRWAIYNG